MQYGKGDTIELYGKVVLVLDNGIDGYTFIGKYWNKVVQRFNDPLSKTHGCRVSSGWDISPYVRDIGKMEVYYYVLVGDVKGWIEERRLIYDV